MRVIDSGLRPPAVAGLTPLLRLAATIGAHGLALGPGCVLGQLAALAVEAGRAGLRVAVLAAPMAVETLPAGRRLPRLGAMDDREERLAAVTLVEDALAQAAALGAELATVDLGVVTLRTDEAELGRCFARREMGQGEPGRRLLTAACGERRAAEPALLDACRHALEKIARAAEKRGMRLALEVAAGPFGVPTPREAARLLDDLRGAPLGIALDTGRLGVLAALGLAPAEPRRAALAREALLVRLADAVGLAGDLLPGLGETDVGAWAASAPGSALRVVTGRADTSAEELTAALAACGA